MDTDRNLLFGVLALQADLIDAAQFIEACLLWTSRKTERLADLLVERGWIEPADQGHIEYLLERKLRKYGGSAHASLAAIPDEIKRSLAALGDGDIQRSLTGSAVSVEPHSVATIDHVAAPAERYCRLRLHAVGGIGRVWLAHDDQLGRDVALKELRPERAEQATLRARFLQEAQITGQLEHPGIIPVYDLAHRGQDRQPFYTMRFVKGRTLSEAARTYHERRSAGRADTLELPGLLNAFVTVCNTVAYAHARGVLHRDLKGQNVLLGDFGEVVVLDWGLAKVVGRPEAEAGAPSVVLDAAGADSGYTVQGQALGTPAYMAPEQAAGRLDQIERRTDVYGLGAILYEILTGVPPFSGPSTEEVLRKVREHQPTPPRERWPEVPPALEALCLRALAKRPEDRPAAAAELAQEVQGWQEFERRQSEEALRESEALYHSLVESLPCNVVRKDLEGRFTFANRCFGELLGRPADQLLGGTDFDYFPAALAEKYRTDDRHVLETGGVLEVIEEVPGKAGPRYFHVLKTAVRDAAGEVMGIQLIGWEVTERKRAEEDLRKSRERFELAVFASQDGLLDLDIEADEVWYSPQMRAMLGYSEEEFPNRRFETEKRVHPDDHTRRLAAIQSLVAGTTDHLELEYRILHKDGSYHWVRDRVVALRRADGKAYRLAGSREDITARKRSEQELHKSRERFELAVLASQDGFSDWDVEAQQVWYSPRVRSMLGYSEEEFPDRPGETEKRVHPDDHARWRVLLHGHVTGATDHLEMEFRMLHKDGSYRWVRDRMVALRRADGRAYRSVESREDITRRKLAEEELARERDLLATLMDNLPDGIYFKDASGRFLRVNQAVADYFGVGDPAEMVGKNSGDFYTEESAAAIAAAEQAVMQTGQPLVAVDEKLTFCNGRVDCVSTTKLPLRDKDGKIVGTFGVSRNYSARNRADGASSSCKRFVLRCIQGPSALSVTVEPGQVVTVGRGGEGWAVDVAIPSVAVSRQHIRVKNDGTACYIQELRTRGGVPILSVRARATLTPEQQAQPLSGCRAWPWQQLPQEQWYLLAEGDLVALPDYCFEVACLSGDC
jgi:PAS domain S-box-containing protein